MIETEMIDSVVFGSLGGLVYLYMTYSLYHILKNLQNNTDTALTKLFINKKARRSYKILAASTVGVAVLFTARATLLALEMQMKPSPIIMLLPVPLAGIAYFFHEIKDVTDDR